MFLSKLFALTVLASAALAKPFSQATVAQVKSDLATAITDLNVLHQDLVAFTGTVGQAATIYSVYNKVISDVKTATSDTKATPQWSEADGKDILTTVQSAEKLIDDSLNLLVSKKPQFANAGAVPLVKQSINSLATSTIALAEALKEKAYASQLADATALEDRIKAAFATAQQAYP